MLSVLPKSNINKQVCGEWQEAYASHTSSHYANRSVLARDFFCFGRRLIIFFCFVWQEAYQRRNANRCELGRNFFNSTIQQMRILEANGESFPSRRRAVEISRSESKSLFSSERTTALHLRLQRLQPLQLQRLQDGLVGLRSWMRPLLLLKLQPLRTKELLLPLLQFLKHHKIVRDFTTRQVAAPLSPPLLKKIHPELVRDCEQRPWRARPPRMWVDFVPAPTLTVRGGEL